MINPAIIKYKDEYTEDLIETLQPFEFKIHGYPVVPTSEVAAFEIFHDVRFIQNFVDTTRHFKSDDYLQHLLHLCKMERQKRHYQGNFILSEYNSRCDAVPGFADNEFNFANQLVVYDLDNCWKDVGKIYHELDLDIKDVALIKGGASYYIDVQQYPNEDIYLNRLCELMSSPACKVTWVRVAKDDDGI